MSQPSYRITLKSETAKEWRERIKEHQGKQNWQQLEKNLENIFQEIKSTNECLTFLKGKPLRREKLQALLNYENVSEEIKGNAQNGKKFSIKYLGVDYKQRNTIIWTMVALKRFLDPLSDPLKEQQSIENSLEIIEEKIKEEEKKYSDEQRGESSDNPEDVINEVFDEDDFLVIEISKAMSLVKSFKDLVGVDQVPKTTEDIDPRNEPSRESHSKSEGYPSDFIFREEYDAIKEKILNGEDVVIYGGGGVGKTTLARAICKELEAKENLECVQLTDLDGRFGSIIEQASKQLHVSFSVQTQRSTPEKIAVIKSELKSLIHERKILFLIDNIKKAEIAELFKLDNCHIVVTTRRESVANGIAKKADCMFELKGMEPGQALQLFEMILSQDLTDDPEGSIAKEISRAVGYLPLTIELIAKQITKNRPWEEINNYIKEKKLASLDSLTSISEQEGSLEKSFDIGFKPLCEESLAIGKSLLWLGLLFPGAAITSSIAALTWEVDTATAADRLRVLADFALIHQSNDSKPVKENEKTYCIHDVWHQVIIKKINKGELSEEAKNYIDSHANYVNAHKELLERFRRHFMAEEMEWFNLLVQSDYLKRFLIWHLLQAEKFQEIHRLFMSFEWSYQQNRDQETSLSYLLDLDMVLDSSLASNVRLDNVPSSLLRLKIISFVQRQSLLKSQKLDEMANLILAGEFYHNEARDFLEQARYSLSQEIEVLFLAVKRLLSLSSKIKKERFDSAFRLFKNRIFDNKRRILAGTKDQYSRVFDWLKIFLLLEGCKLVQECISDGKLTDEGKEIKAQMSRLRGEINKSINSFRPGIDLCKFNLQVATLEIVSNTLLGGNLNEANSFSRLSHSLISAASTLDEDKSGSRHHENTYTSVIKARKIIDLLSEVENQSSLSDESFENRFRILCKLQSNLITLNENSNPDFELSKTPLLNYEFIVFRCGYSILLHENGEVESAKLCIEEIFNKWKERWDVRIKYRLSRSTQRRSMTEFNPELRGLFHIISAQIHLGCSEQLRRSLYILAQEIDDNNNLRIKIGFCYSFFEFISCRHGLGKICELLSNMSLELEFSETDYCVSATSIKLPRINYQSAILRFLISRHTLEDAEALRDSLTEFQRGFSDLRKNEDIALVVMIAKVIDASKLNPHDHFDVTAYLQKLFDETLKRLRKRTIEESFLQGQSGDSNGYKRRKICVAILTRKISSVDTIIRENLTQTIDILNCFSYARSTQVDKQTVKDLFEWYIKSHFYELKEERKGGILKDLVKLLGNFELFEEALQVLNFIAQECDSMDVNGLLEIFTSWRTPLSESNSELCYLIFKDINQLIAI